MLRLKATVIWKDAADGGLSHIPESGLQPSFSVAGDLIISKVVHPTKSQMNPGIPHEVIIELPYGEVYEKEIAEGMNFSLNVGARVIATGIVQEKM